MFHLFNISQASSHSFLPAADFSSPKSIKLFSAFFDEGFAVVFDGSLGFAVVDDDFVWDDDLGGAILGAAVAGADSLSTLGS